MSAYTTTVAVFGIKVTQAEADKLVKELDDPYEYLFSDGVDLRIHDVVEPGFDHFFGIELGEDNIVDLVRSPPTDKITQFEKICTPYLANITRTPDVHIVTFTA